MLPLSDDNGTVFKVPVITYGIIIISILAHFIIWPIALSTFQPISVKNTYPCNEIDDPQIRTLCLGTSTYTISSEEQFYDIFALSMNSIRNGFSLITHIFLHENFLHLLGNMYFLWIFGDNVEMSYGRWKFAFFYLIAGIVASILFLLVSQSTDYLMGASGAISAVMGAYYLLYPKSKIQTVYGSFSAYYFLIFWFMFQGIYSLNAGDGVAYLAHLFSFLIGAILTYIGLSLRMVSFVERVDYLGGSFK